MIGHRARKLIRELWGDGTPLFGLGEIHVSHGIIKVPMFLSSMPPCDLRSVIAENALRDLPHTGDDFMLFEKIDLITNAQEEVDSGKTGKA